MILARKRDGRNVSIEIGIASSFFWEAGCLGHGPRFPGVWTGACVGHVGPEALAGVPIGKLQEGDVIDIVIDTRQFVGFFHVVGTGGGHGLRQKRARRAQ